MKKFEILAKIESLMADHEEAYNALFEARWFVKNHSIWADELLEEILEIFSRAANDEEAADEIYAVVEHYDEEVEAEEAWEALDHHDYESDYAF